MLAVFLLIPFLLIRFPLLSHFGKNALSRAAYFAPVQGKEKIAYMNRTPKVRQKKSNFWGVLL